MTQSNDTASAAVPVHPIVRIARENDVPKIAAIYRLHVLHGTSSFETEPPAVDEMLRRFNALQSSNYPYLVAEHNGELAGYAYASAYRPRAAYRCTVENSVYLHPDCRGQGIGTALLSGLIAACEQQAFHQMVAVIGDSANTASIRLHERLGFRMVGTLRDVGHKHGQWLDTVLMQRMLNVGSG